MYFLTCAAEKASSTLVTRPSPICDLIEHEVVVVQDLNIVLR